MLMEKKWILNYKFISKLIVCMRYRFYYFMKTLIDVLDSLVDCDIVSENEFEVPKTKQKFKSS